MQRGIRHWINPKGPSRTVFATTTCLNFARLLERPQMRDALAVRLASDCLYYGVVLHAYCVMPHHLHMLLRGPNDKEVSWFMQRFKSNSAKELLPFLTEREIASMSPEFGKEGHKFWKISFRGIPVRDERMFWSVARYIHLNPVRDDLTESTLLYPWSSAAMYEECLWSEEHGINEAMRQRWLPG